MPKEDIIKQAKDIIEKGKEKGYLTLQEILDLLPSNFDSIKRLDDIFYALDEMGIKIIDRDTERVRHFENDKVIDLERRKHKTSDSTAHEPRVSDVIRNKAINLFTYLRDLTSLRSKSIRTVDSYEVLWFGDIPKEKECFTPAWGGARSEEEEVWLTIKKPTIKPFPPVPEEVEQRVSEASLSDSSTLPELLPRILNSEYQEPEGTTGDEEYERIPQYLELSDHPRVEQLWFAYLEKHWIPWSEERERVSKVQKVYAQLHGMYQQKKKLGEQYEVVIGLGLLSWRVPSGHEVRRHLITIQATIDLRRDTLFVTPTAEGSKLTLEQDMLEASDRPSVEAQKTIEGCLDDLGDDIWNYHEMEEILRRWINDLSPHGIYNSGFNYGIEVKSTPSINYAPALILRKRTARSILKTYEDIIKQLENKENIPLGVKRLVSVIDDREDSSHDTDSDRHTEVQFKELFFPLPSNNEQRRIVEEIKNRQGVLVQGPPGTGKSHTILNLICHLLASGNRVLITSQTPRALRVIKEMMNRNEATRNMSSLCVNVLGNDINSLRDLEASVEGITNKHNDWTPEVNASEIKMLNKTLDQLRRTEANLNTKLREIRERETYEYSVCDGAYRGTAQKIAELLSNEKTKHAWIGRSIPEGNLTPLSNKEALDLLDLHQRVTPELLAETSKAIVNTNDLPKPKEFISLHEAERSAEKCLAEFKDILNIQIKKQLSNADVEELRMLKEALDTLVIAQSNILKHIQPWVSLAVKEIVADKDRAWKELLNISQSYLSGIHNEARLADARKISLPKECELSKVKADAKALLDHLEEGRGLRFSFLRSKSIRTARYLIKKTRVNGRPCDNTDSLKELISSLDVDDKLDTLWEHWGPYAGKTKKSRIGQVGELEDLCEPLKVSLDLYPLLNIAKNACWSINGLSEPSWHKIEEIKEYQRLIEAIECERHLKEIKVVFNNASQSLSSCMSLEDAHDVVEEIYNAIIHREVKAYAKAYSDLEEIQSKRIWIERRNDLDRRLHKTLPNIAYRIRSESHQTKWQDHFAHFEEAWRWAQANNWLEQLSDRDEDQIGEELKITQDRIQKTIGKLATAQAWKHCLNRLTEHERRHLVAWSKSMRKIGKGKGKYAEKHRREARQNMEKCRSAIPAWIMPLYRIHESVKPGIDSYDVVIIDEASQSSIDAIFLMYLAKKIVVVGDDMQISPDSIGVHRDQVDLLRDKYIKDLPQFSAFDLETSFFGLAEILFGSRVVLREHFRCMPEIIQFSNNLCYYNKPLTPLRQYPPDRLEPVVTHHVQDGYREGDSNSARNIPEAEQIVKTITECCSNPAYAGKTMGVITLLGHYQDRYIDKLLLEAIGPEEIEKRIIVCGNAYDFQGDERDIIFLSMVAAPDDNGMRAIASPADERRFNVAASRARDQMWLFHTPTTNDFRNKECLRYRLLEYCLNPQLQSHSPDRDRCQSDFERAVYDCIDVLGYRVIPQYRVAGYYIDLVVEGMKNRLAVECDGDQWHGPEQYEADMARQRTLERCGWRFHRIRGSEFYRDPDLSIDQLVKKLSDLGIYPSASQQEKEQEEERSDSSKAEDHRTPEDQEEGGGDKEEEEETFAKSNLFGDFKGFIIEILKERTMGKDLLPDIVLRRRGISARGKNREKMRRRVRKAIKNLLEEGTIVEYRTDKRIRFKLTNAVESDKNLSTDTAEKQRRNEYSKFTFRADPVQKKFDFGVQENGVEYRKSDQSINHCTLLQNELGKILKNHPEYMEQKSYEILIGRYGPYIKYKNGKNASLSIDIVNEALDRVNIPCPECGSKLMEKTSKYGVFLGCSNYPKCRKIVKWDQL